MLRAVSLAVVLVLLLAACTPTADSFSIHRFSASADNQFPALDRTVTDAAVASRLYEQVRTLRLHEGDVFCALDFGVRHELSFFMRGQRILHGVMEPGCGVIDLWPTPIPRP